MNQLLVEIQQLLTFQTDRISVALMALLLTVVAGILTGPAMSNAVPLFWSLLAGLFGGFGRRLDKRQRKTADLILRGFFVTLPVVVLSFEIGMLARQGLGMVHFYLLPNIIILSLLLSSGAVWSALLKLRAALMKSGKTIKGAYYTISRSTRTDLSGADDYGITRAGMALAARSFDKGVVAPVFWFVVAGFPAAFTYAGLAALSWRFGRDGFTKGFGRFPLLLERLMGFIPNIIAGFLIALAGLFTPTGGITRGFMGILRMKGKAPYEEGGLPVTAMAAALHVGLGGPAVDLDGSAMQRSWAGPENATAQLGGSHLMRALYITIVAHLLFALLLGGVLLLIYGRIAAL
jgi:adenosylcobinamide-phosphate synthase